MKWEKGEKEREGDEKNKVREEYVVLLAKFSRVCPVRLREEGRRCQLSCNLGIAQVL